MDMNQGDYLKKALLDTQERVRDYMMYSDKMEDQELYEFFRSFAEVEGEHAQQLQKYIAGVQH